ncbi:hypothetical protein PO909_009730 [Leuciscus waleckii]
MLTILLITAMLGQAFPENIAFYYPVDPVNALNITAVHADTVVTVSISDSSWTYQDTLPAGKPVTVTLPLGIEEYSFGQTLQTVRISSTERIVIQSISQRGDSVQTNVVQPMKNLGTFYSIPALNYSKMINTFFPSTINISKRFSSYRLVVINGVDMSNLITIIKKPKNFIYILDPYAVLQLQTDGTEIAVKSDYKVAVMLTHPCEVISGCKCNMVVNQLFPDTLWDSRFAVPGILNVWLHLTSSTDIIATGGNIQSGTFEAYSSKLLSLPSLHLGSQFINTSDPASLRLVSPGFIIEPIPLSRFSACYLVVPVNLTSAKALVIAETEYRDSVYVDGDLLSSTKWSNIIDSEYSSVIVSLHDTHVIWHPSTKIAVYVFERSATLYGGPAISLSANPDPVGCGVIPPKFDIILTPQTWPESHQHCMLISDELFSPSNKAAQMEMVDILNSEGLNERLWIGLRRSLLTLEWYRQKGEEVHNLLKSAENHGVTVMLSHLFFMSLVCQGLSVESYGKDFITAFPENIANYHPQESSNTLQITAFYSDTTVSITVNHTNVYNEKLQSGQTKVVHFPKYVERYQFTRSFYFVRISSSKLIVVLWISQRGDSVQSNFVQPVKNLGKLYSIPFINYNQMLASLYNTEELLDLDNWRCIIINAGNIMNVISIQTVGMNAFNFTLSPYELYQFQTNGSEIKVYSRYTVAVLLTHPCAETTRCDCNMVMNHVLPENLWGRTFVVPSVKNLNSTWLQVTSTTNVTLRSQNITILDSNSSDRITFPYLKSGPQLMTASNHVSIRLISPGLVLELMPESMFAACYLLQMNSTGAEALIIAETASRGDVYVDADLLSSTDWKTIANSNYSTVSVSLSGTHIIWHPASRIGVYMFERMESGIPYGGPAVILNEDPDRDGCMADPALYNSTTDVMTWPESHDYCLNATLQLSSPSSARAQREMTNFLQKDGGPRYWIGLRRSLLTLEWYWKNGNNSEYGVNYTKWADGHREDPWKSLCASVSRDANNDFSWKSLTVVSYGDHFITAFPENIGFFYPRSPWNYLIVTALHDNTTFTVFYKDTQKNLQIQQSGQTLNVRFSAEVNKLGSSILSVRVTSDKNITVVSQSRRASSIQNSVVQPTVNLGTDYMIPLLDYPGYLESFDLPRLANATMRYRSFKLLIINAVDSENTITVVKQTSTNVEEETFSIESYQLVQLQTNGSVLRVKSSKQVAVIFTHPCVETADCNCNMVMNQILPTQFQGRSFIVPSIFNVAKTQLLVLSENSYSLFHNGSQLEAAYSDLLPFSNLETSQLVNASDRVSLRLVSPGLIVELIPDTMFFACYLLQFYAQYGRAVVIAETDSKDDVRTHKGLLSASEWTEIAGTKYSSTVVTIADRSATIWHPTSKIAVYMLEYMSAKVIFGGPAIPINEKPDLHGCVLVPGAFAVGPDPLNWMESLEYCMNKENQFACPVSKAVLKDMADNLTAEDGTGWIGLRRSLLTTEWYWQEYDPSVSYVHWDDGQPLDFMKGLCASMSLDPKKDFKWQSARCCEKKKPVCYKRPAFLNPSQSWFLDTIP